MGLRHPVGCLVRMSLFWVFLDSQSVFFVDLDCWFLLLVSFVCLFGHSVGLVCRSLLYKRVSMTLLCMSVWTVVSFFLGLVSGSL